MYLLHRSVGPSVQFLYSGCMIAAKFRIMTIEQRAVRGTAENFVICDTQKSYSENLFRRLSEKLSGYFQFHVFHDIENLKIAAKSMQVNILLIGEEYGKEDRDEIPARQKYLLIGEKIPNERSPTEIPFFRYQSVSSMLELLLQEKDQENSEVQTHQIQLVSDRSQTVKANVNGLIGIYSPVHRIGKTRFAMRMGRVLSESIPTLYLNLEGYSGLNYYLPEESGMNLGDLLYYMKQESINPVWKISTLISHMNGLDYIAPIRAEQDFREVTKEEWNQLLDLILEKSIYKVIILDLGDVLQELLEDDSITEIMVNGIDHIFYEKEGRIFRSKKCFLSQERLLDVIQQIVGESNRYVNEASPIVDARLKDGSRVNVVLNPVAVNGPILTIRKFPSEAITMEELIRIGSVTDDAANFLKKLVAAKYNIFVSGGTGAGKTTFLNALSNYIPKGERLITIEDNAELQIQGVQNLVRLEARGPNAEGEGAVTIRDLIKSALRMRPDRIVVGEVRGEETVDMISSAMLNGHSGSMSTGHANNPTDMLHRLETMMLMGIDLPLQAIQRQVASALDIIIHLGRLRDKTRKVLQIVEVEGYEDGRIQTKVLYEFKEEGMKNGKIQGCLMKKNEITNKEKLLAAGYHTI